MTGPKNVLLVALVALVLALLGAGAWWLGRTDPPAPPPLVVGAQAPVREPPAVVPDEPRVELAADAAPDYGSLETTVVYPLQVELELVQASSTLAAEGVARQGSGATAKLSGSVVGPQGAGVRAEVRFVAGANAGRVLYTDGLGRFGADGLYPGLSIVRVRGAGIVGAEREVRMRREALLNLSFARPARLVTEVVDREGKPIAGARVRVDGQEVESDAEGLAEFAAVAPGEVLVVVRKPGYASLRQLLNVNGASSIEKGQLKFRLEAGASLQISIVEALNAQQQALVYLLPEFGDRDRRFPWQDVNPLRVWPGGTAIVNDLPQGRVSVRLYHAGAVSKPARRAVELQPGGRESVEFHLEPAPVVTGRVTQEGGPVEGALVRLEAPDRTAAMLSVFGETNYLFLENDVIPDLPPALQEATTNARGEFQLSAFQEIAPVRYVTALSADGKRIAHAVLEAGQTRLELALEPARAGSGEVAIQMEGRWQALPVEVTVEGAPSEPRLLPPGRDLRIGGLAEGTWRVSVRWNGEQLVQGQELVVSGEARLAVTLPEGAIAGQDAETVRRRAPQR